MSSHPPDAFLCPLMVECFGPTYQAFSSRTEGNAAVDRYQACGCPDERAQEAATLYLRHLPLVKKVLGKFCRQSECHPGVCLPHDLFGDSFPIFQKALDEYDSSYGLDFLGYVSQRLHWGFRKRAMAQLRELDEAVPQDRSSESSAWEDVEDRLLDRVYARELLSSLGSRRSRARHAPLRLWVLLQGAGGGERHLPGRPAQALPASTHAPAGDGCRAPGPYGLSRVGKNPTASEALPPIAGSDLFGHSKGAVRARFYSGG